MSKFKVGDKVKIIKNESFSINKIGDVGIITGNYKEVTYKVTVGHRENSANWHSESELELYTGVEYEDQWYLNDGNVDIPEDADKLEKDGSVVVFRYRKVKPFEFGEKLRIKKSLWKGHPEVVSVNPGFDYVDAVYISKYFDKGIKVYVNNGEKSWECCFTTLDKVERLT